MSNDLTTDDTETIQTLLSDAVSTLQAVTDTARLDAEVLLANVLERDRSYLYTWPERAPSADERTRFLQRIENRRLGMPVAYLTGVKEFWSMNFKVTTDTLVPRADTETLVQLAVEHLTHNPGPLLDLGTGCGAIAISVAKELHHLRSQGGAVEPDGIVIDVTATDYSVMALNIARENARRLQTPVTFHLSDWFSQLPEKKWRLIVSNPPYLAHDDHHLPTLQHEPRSALVAEDNGLSDIKNIATDATRHLQNNGTLMVEHGVDQGMAVRQIMQQSGYTSVGTTTDIAGRDRVTTGHWHGQ